VRALNEPIKILVCRRYGTTIRNTCFALFKDILTKWKLYPQHVRIRESDFNIKFPNGSEIIFTGLDEETKLLSLSGIGTIFIEEIFEVPKPMLEQLNLRMRGAT
jgi:phage terminase large subunit